MKSTRHAAAVWMVALVATACLGSAGDSSTAVIPPPPTALTILYVRGVIAQGTMTYRRSAPLTLRCSPPGGSIPAADVACSAIGRDPDRYFGRSTAGCIGPALQWSVRIRGTFRGRPIRRSYDMCDYPEARAWTDLGGTRLVGSLPARVVVTVPQATPGYVAPALAALHADGCASQSSRCLRSATPTRRPTDTRARTRIPRPARACRAEPWSCSGSPAA